MAKNFNTLRERMSPERRARVEKRVAQTLEKMALHDLRRARRLNQMQVATGLKSAQSEVSKIENRADMHVSTLRQYIEALGGHLARCRPSSPIKPSSSTSPRSDNVSPADIRWIRCGPRRGCSMMELSRGKQGKL